MNKKTNTGKVIKGIVCLLIVLCILNSLSGCAMVDSFIASVKGELIGNAYKISEYDNFGNSIMTVNGDKITLNGSTDTSGESSSYIDITIDGYEWEHVGNTLVFAQKGVDMITDFQIPTEINSDGNSTGLMDVDRVINNYRNMFGKKSVVIIFSQTGAPIGLFQGDECYTEVPSDLPKTTKISIDGKLVYVHRANVDIMPVELFSN